MSTERLVPADLFRLYEAHQRNDLAVLTAAHREQWEENRCDELEEFVIRLGRYKSSYGQSTTHMSKLLPRLEGGGGGGCPVVAFGIREAAYVDDGAAPVSPVGGEPKQAAPKLGPGRGNG